MRRSAWGPAGASRGGDGWAEDIHTCARKIHRYMRERNPARRSRRRARPCPTTPTDCWCGQGMIVPWCGRLYLADV